MASKVIMIADDDIGIVESMKMLLQDEGYRVVAPNYTKTYDAISAVKPDLLLLDIFMSGIDGRDITKQLKAHPDTKDMPIIIVSANRQTESIAKDAGADDWVPKPYEAEILLNKISQVLPA
jgi:CheY-like chemotaxis protein